MALGKFAEEKQWPTCWPEHMDLRSERHEAKLEWFLTMHHETIIDARVLRCT